LSGACAAAMQLFVKLLWPLVNVNADRLAAVWPLIGIVFEVIVLIIFIAVCEVRSRKKAAEEEAKCK